MLVRDLNTNESYLHVCDDSSRYTKKALEERFKIHVHDCSTFIIIEGKNGVEFQHIKYCPYCGVDIQSEYDKF